MARGESDSVTIGTWVKVMEHGSGDAEVYHIVDNRETDYLQNKISPENPVGKALLGSKPGEKINIDGPNGRVTFSVLEIGRH